MPEYKDIHFRVSRLEWEQFFRIFPETGHRTGFFKQCMREAIRLGPSSRFVQQVRKRIEEEE